MALNRLCLDTSAYGHFMRGHPAVVERIESADWIGVPSVVLGELHTGFLRGSRLQENENDLAEFLASPVVVRLDVDGSVARTYAEIVVGLRESGTPIPTNDVWIAATAAQAGATVLTYDAHFARIRRVGSLVLDTP